MKPLLKLGLEGLPEEAREELLAELGEVVFMNVMRRTHKALTLTQQDALTRLLEESAEDPENEKRREALAQFLAAQVPDFDTYVREEVAALETKYKANLEPLE